MCAPCGAIGAPCCTAAACVAGAACDDGTCHACGQAGQVCCDVRQCASTASLQCVSGATGAPRCEACGGAEQPCCGTTRCDAGLECVGLPLDTRACEACGTFGHYCCSGGSECRIGVACRDDHDCAAGLTCAPTGLASGGRCTRDCTDSGDGREQSDCGGTQTTCLTLPFPESAGAARSQCARTCSPHRSPRTCADDEACVATPETTGFIGLVAGCAAFCHGDAQCQAGQHCDRAGICRASAVDLTLAPDGSPCDPTREPSAGPSVQCRGLCVVVDTGARGLCASVIDVAPPASGPSGCPDPGTQQDGLDGLDDLALCMYRSCACDRDCPSPLVCIHGGCSYASDAAPGQPTCP